MMKNKAELIMDLARVLLKLQGISNTLGRDAQGSMNDVIDELSSGLVELSKLVPDEDVRDYASSATPVASADS